MTRPKAKAFKLTHYRYWTAFILAANKWQCVGEEAQKT
jgi:hypothetical protein